jgi:uncharacterized coiled-coil protein SlyX
MLSAIKTLRVPPSRKVPGNLQAAVVAHRRQTMEMTTCDWARRLNAAERRSAAAERKVRATALTALLILVGLLALALAPVAQAQKSGGSSSNLEARVTALEGDTTALQTRVTTLESQVASLQNENATQAQQISRLQNDTTALQNTVNSQATQIASLQSADVTLGDRITPLETKTAPLSVSGSDFVISGKNVHIVDGSGFTESTSGLGNLTIGYNASRSPMDTDVRTGSHNLILGDLNNYSSFGGLVAGLRNTISARYASVSGGQDNTASGLYASVSGGNQNVANNQYASVSGGQGNTASGLNASVSGGRIQHGQRQLGIRQRRGKQHSQRP